MVHKDQFKWYNCTATRLAHEHSALGIHKHTKWVYSTLCASRECCAQSPRCCDACHAESKCCVQRVCSAKLRDDHGKPSKQRPQPARRRSLIRKARSSARVRGNGSTPWTAPSREAVEKGTSSSAIRKRHLRDDAVGMHGASERRETRSAAGHRS